MKFPSYFEIKASLDERCHQKVWEKGKEMSRKSVYAKVSAFAVTVAFYTGEVAAKSIVHPVAPPSQVPEIDGPAGIAALALLVSAGIVAYNRYRK